MLIQMFLFFYSPPSSSGTPEGYRSLHGWLGDRQGKEPGPGQKWTGGVGSGLDAKDDDPAGNGGTATDGTDGGDKGEEKKDGDAAPPAAEGGEGGGGGGDGDGDGGAAADPAAGGVAEGGKARPNSVLVAQLRDMTQMSDAACERALWANNNEFDAAVSWLFEHTDDVDFNERLSESDFAPSPAAAVPAGGEGGGKGGGEEKKEGEGVKRPEGEGGGGGSGGEHLRAAAKVSNGQRLTHLLKQLEVRSTSMRTRCMGEVCVLCCVVCECDCSQVLRTE